MQWRAKVRPAGNRTEQARPKGAEYRLGGLRKQSEEHPPEAEQPIDLNAHTNLNVRKLS